MRLETGPASRERGAFAYLDMTMCGASAKAGSGRIAGRSEAYMNIQDFPFDGGGVVSTDVIVRANTTVIEIWGGLGIHEGFGGLK